MGVEIKGLDRLVVKANKAKKYAREATISATQEVTNLVEGYAVENAHNRFLHPTGELAGSVKQEVVEDSSGTIKGRVWSDKKQAVCECRPC